MPLGTTPVPVHNGHVIPSCATMALRMKALLFGNLLRNVASSSSALNATICDFGGAASHEFVSVTAEKPVH